jgi:prophage regulatory protein
MSITVDILERLRIDPGKRTVGELLQDREQALHEIVRLRADVDRLRTVRTSIREPTVNPSLPTHRSGSLLRLADVCELVGVGRSTIYKWTSEGRFPSPIHVSERAVRWRLEEIEHWRAAL